jgi:zinc transport system ATP-binding protein
MQASLIDVQWVSYSVQWKEIIRNLSFTIQKNQIVSIIWYNWSWKSTVLKMLVWSITPTSWLLIKKPWLTIGYVPQKLSFNTSLPVTVKDFLGMYNTTTTWWFTCSLLDITPLLQQPLHSLSWWQLQKVLIYNALLGSPEVLLLDEPTAWLDVVAQKEFYSLIQHIHEHHKITIVLVSHDIHTVYSKSELVICLHKWACCIWSPQEPWFPSEMKNLFGDYVTPYLHTHSSHDR